MVLKKLFWTRNIQTIIALSLFVSVYYYIYDALINSNQFVSAIASALLVVAGFLVCYLLGKYYCSFWYSINRHSIFLFFIEKFLVPISSIYALLILGNTKIGKDIAGLILYVLMLVLFIVLSDFKGSVRKIILEINYTPSRNEQRMLFLQFPPKSRIDLLPFDIVYFLFITYIFISSY